MAQLAYETAADQYARAIELLERQDSAEDLRIELLLAMGDAHNRAGQDEAAKRAFMEAAELARATARAEALAKAAIGFSGQLRIGFDVEDHRAVALLEEALTALGDDDSSVRAIALSRLALARYRSGAQAERRWQVDEALEVARRLDPATLAAVLVSRHWTLYGPDDLDERVAAAGELAGLGETLDDAELILHARQAQVHDFFELGRTEEMQAAVDERDRLAEELRHPYYLWSVMVTRAMNAANAGRFAEAETAASGALHYRVEADVQQAFTVHSAQFLQVLWLQGRLGELDPNWVRRAGWDPESHRALYLLTWMAAGAGTRRRRGRASRGAAGQGPRPVARDIEWFVAMAALADACDVLRHDKAAVQLYDMLLPYEARNCAVGQSAFYGAAAHWLGILAGVLDRHDDAVRHLRAGLARHESMAAPPFVALSQAALSRALRRRDADGDAPTRCGRGRCAGRAGARHCRCTRHAWPGGCPERLGGVGVAVGPALVVRRRPSSAGVVDCPCCRSASSSSGISTLSVASEESVSSASSVASVSSDASPASAASPWSTSAAAVSNGESSASAGANGSSRGSIGAAEVSNLSGSGAAAAVAETAATAAAASAAAAFCTRGRGRPLGSGSRPAVANEARIVPITTSASSTIVTARPAPVRPLLSLLAGTGASVVAVVDVVSPCSAVVVVGSRRRRGGGYDGGGGRGRRCRGGGGRPCRGGVLGVAVEEVTVNPTAGEPLAPKACTVAEPADVLVGTKSVPEKSPPGVPAVALPRSKTLPPWMNRNCTLVSPVLPASLHDEKKF